MRRDQIGRFVAVALAASSLTWRGTEGSSNEGGGSHLVSLHPIFGKVGPLDGDSHPHDGGVHRLHGEVHLHHGYGHKNPLTGDVNNPRGTPQPHHGYDIHPHDGGHDNPHGEVHVHPGHGASHPHDAGHDNPHGEVHVHPNHGQVHPRIVGHYNPHDETHPHQDHIHPQHGTIHHPNGEGHPHHVETPFAAHLHNDTKVKASHYGVGAAHSSKTFSEALHNVHEKSFDNNTNHGRKIHVELLRRPHDEPHAISAFINKHAAPSSPNRIVRQYEKRGICFIFLADQHGLTAPRVWQRWYEDARIMLNTTLVEALIGAERKRLPSGALSHSRFVHGFVVMTASNKEVSRTTHDKLPAWIQDDPVVGDYGPLSDPGTLSSMVIDGLDHGVKNFKESTLFIILPADSIPVKSFNHIWGEISMIPKSRFTLTGFDPHDETHYPQHQPWFFVTAPHATLLSSTRETWINVGGLHPAVYQWPLKLLIDSSPGAVQPTADNFLRQEEYIPRSVLVRGPLSHPLQSGWVWEYHKDHSFISEDQDAYHRWIGVFDGSSDSFKQLSFGFLKYLAESRDTWFMRGVSDQTEIVGCQMSNIDYFTFWVRIGGGDGYMFGESPELREKRFEDTAIRRNYKCLLVHSLEKLMHLQAANTNMTKWSHSRGYVPMGDPGWFHPYVD